MQVEDRQVEILLLSEMRHDQPVQAVQKLLRDLDVARVRLPERVGGSRMIWWSWIIGSVARGWPRMSPITR